jgi:excisionase family DNA binding protein
MGRGDQGGLSVSQAAQMLGVSRETICRWCEMGDLECFQNQRDERRCSQEQIDRLIALLELKGPLGVTFTGSFELGGTLLFEPLGDDLALYNGDLPLKAQEERR